jgi:hypothetical protein
MSLDDQLDPPIAAVAALVRAAIVADLGPEMAVAIYDDPRVLQTLTAGKLPALCLYRESERRRRRNSTMWVDDITVQFDYVLPSTALEKRAVRWPALQVVWHKIANVVIAGKHVSVSAGADVLAAAGLTVEQENSAQVAYRVAEGGGQNYPYFRGQLVAALTSEPADAATLNDFLRFYMSFDEPGGDHNDPTIELNITLPAFGS